MIRIPALDPIEYLVRRKFKDYDLMHRFTPISTIHQGGISAEHRQKRLKQFEAYEAELRAKPNDEISALLAQEQEKERQEQRLQSELEEHARFFNQPFAKADFAHWSKATYWKLDEALALVFGKAPEAVTWEKIKSYVDISPFARNFARVRDLALRAIAWNQLYDPVLPGIFLAWAKRTEIAIPSELLEAVEKRGITVADWKDMYDKLKVQYDEMIGKANQEIDKGNDAVVRLHEERELLKSENAQLQAQLVEVHAKAWEGFDPDSETSPRVQKAGLSIAL